MINLRRIHEDDLPILFSQRNHPEIYRWCRQNAPLHWENHVAWYKKQAENDSLSMFVIAEGPSVIGTCGLTDIDYVNSRAEFSLYIAPEFQKSGYGKRALIELFKYGFNDLGLNRIWGETFEGNGALKLFQNLGMKIEGVRDEFYYRSGRYISSTLIGLGARDFNPNGSKASFDDADVSWKLNAEGESPNW